MILWPIRLLGARTIRLLDYSTLDYSAKGGIERNKGMELTNKPCKMKFVNYGRKIRLLKSKWGIVLHKSAGDRRFFLKLQTVAKCDGFSNTTGWPKGVVQLQIINYGWQLCLFKFKDGIFLFQFSRRSLVLQNLQKAAECDFFSNISCDERKRYCLIWSPGAE